MSEDATTPGQPRPKAKAKTPTGKKKPGTAKATAAKKQASAKKRQRIAKAETPSAVDVNQIGRPTSYTEALGNEFCARITVGESIRRICTRNDHMPSVQTIYNWFSAHPQFLEQYERAKAACADYFAEEILDISDDATNDWMETLDKDGQPMGWRLNGEHVQRSRLRVDARKWLMTKLQPKKYGEKIQTHHSGSINYSDLTDAELALKLKQLESQVENDNGA